MPWDTIQLNDGREIPSLGFGTWKMGNGDGPITQVDQAISVGFSHIDTAQLYKNEAEAGIAIRFGTQGNLDHHQIFWDGRAGYPDVYPEQPQIRVSYVDLYLIHHPLLAVPDIPTVWRQMEEIHAQGLSKSIGVSNFDANQLAILLASAEVKPAANQILLHPYVYARQLPILEYAAKHKIVIEAYSALIPITSLPGGPVDKPVNAIAGRLGVSGDQVLLAWTKAKGAVVVTTSSKKARLLGYLNAGDLVLTEDDIAAIDAAGAEGAPLSPVKRIVRRLAGIALVAFAVGYALGLRY
ncbi:Aldo/keto reductase [Mycena belliarum]|uniref:Aldo/keto reductase n=1 Tax=Mycena belliarum TaxID=1033014 RepID=A0AAD6TZY9_9AGAR|nr:Aldo/keto reductase [Mycena belliae]